MDVTKVTRNILLLTFPTQEAAASTMLRFQEHYESPVFKDKIFTLGVFRKWYSQHYGGWTYLSDWQGFNVPSTVFRLFIQGLFDPLTEAEAKLVNLIKHRTDRFYVIASFKDADTDVVSHELAHALYATNDNYKKQVDKALRGHSLSSLRTYLKELGYHQSVIKDECHAYLSASSEYLVSAGVPFPKSLSDSLAKIRIRFLKGG